MKPGLKEKLENYLQDMGGVVPYNEVRRMVEEVWESPKGGHYRMETLTRRSRKDNKLEESNERIGKTYNEQGVITGFFYKRFAEPQKKVDREFVFKTTATTNTCCFWAGIDGVHSSNCKTLKVKENRLW